MFYVYVHEQYQIDTYLQIFSEKVEGDEVHSVWQ